MAATNRANALVKSGTLAVRANATTSACTAAERSTEATSGEAPAATLASTSRWGKGTDRSRTPAATAGIETSASAWRTSRDASPTPARVTRARVAA